ncbi:MAG: hypothetical protein IPM50_00225 [Acidobacteriota bacterium]|nr:MAG: hypothetical protein IPM50_00225 [Acidobacteriota bacterium]
MGRRKAGYVWTDKKTGHLYARVQLRDSNGKVKQIYKRALNPTHAEQLASEILEESDARGQGYIEGRSMTFRKLADWYKKEYVIPPVYSDGKKVEGMRTWESERLKIDRIAAELGRELINEMDETIFRKYKLKRLKSVSITTVNRDFESVRAMFRKAKKKRWIKEVPDFDGFIDKSLENRRTVTVTNIEEKKILKEARKLITTSAPRLYALIIALRDSGARPNELYPVNDYSEDKSKYEPIRWRDLFDERGQFRNITRLVSYKGKLREERLAVITERMKKAFLELWRFLEHSKNVTPANAARLDNMVFPHTTYKKSWDIVRTAAGYPDLRLRDLRRDWVTRLGRLGYSDKLAQRGAGHKKMQTSFEYTEFDEAAAMQAKLLLDKDNR